ncbi:glycerol-3-phosphate dehydrogenase (NAD(P)+) [Weissella uvarum]|uniref:NAD(P)H-dependent glycerol-3-phosphate dehydrogenase n=1 Tax=Weissella uvarum TaxID=1479233 RepID=UPI001960C0C7|nr:NAD(P)H-dependent glycerol-3-phosphate dehydrogenase [Weissella uvarum]MBM7617994.1 glycerol-3-phosphate dehydrogenase (NAD(P)+) [Weissella uvarum]MCM0596213.1 NAD(P)H-dependent glycerol-3-phosphate dehydrogenase [Weissella uvarum]
MKIAVLGAGSWGTALATVAADNQHEVALWTHKPAQAEEINATHLNQKYLGDNPLPEGIVATGDMADAVKDAQIVLSVVPTQATRIVAKQLAETLADFDNQKIILVGATKGLEPGTYKRVSEMLDEEVPDQYLEGLAVIAGPSHAEGVVKHDPTLVTAVSENLAVAEKVQAAFTNDDFRVYTGSDVVGAEVGAALKNVIAIAAGALDGLGYDANAKAALFTRGLAEISRLGQAFGANPLTFMGLSGVGDLFVTATSIHSRNFRAGKQLGEGKTLEEVVQNMGMVIEGISTTKVAYEIAQQKNVTIPITEAIYHVIYDGLDIKAAIHDLMSRPVKQEGK